ncbi:hypothetical protein [Asticcacaulis sp. AC402]|uniref:hypothetical protein n=1 Tax=Asticcacaulis sp. AC402 TaxID=1282361 RepID=UPI0003C3B187|nr:hypothetical protein [Asticcacaulis sp. AC402]ESQ74694.1 hypothetical protein ABAC402_13125 [Asticcacaulis sp. AC402]
MATFSTLMIGPDGRGRDFRIRAQAQAPDDRTSPEAQARNLPLVLARWAESGEPEVVACLPLPGGDCLVLRARNQGRTQSGFACFANAVIVPAAMGPQQERVCVALLSLLPEPDGSDGFARKPLTVEGLSDPAIAAHSWDGLAPRWYRRVVVTDGSAAETVLTSILGSVAQDETAPTLTWATSAHWASVLGHAALIVVPPGRETQAVGFEPARMTAAGFDGNHFDVPMPIRIRERFLELLAPEVRALAAQRIDTAAATLDDQILTVATRVVAGMNYDQALTQTLRFATIPESELAGFFTRLSQRLFAWFLQSDAHKGQLRRTLEIFELADNRPLLRSLGPVCGLMLDSPSLCGELDLALVARLAERHDLLAILAARQDLARILGDVPADVAIVFYDRLMSDDLRESTARGLSAAARQLSGRKDLPGMAIMLNRHLSGAASLIKTQLLIELVLLIYQTDMPASRRYG